MTYKGIVLAGAVCVLALAVPSSRAASQGGHVPSPELIGLQGGHVPSPELAQGGHVPSPELANA